MPEGAHFVTPEGHMVDKFSVNFWADDSTGLLSRRAEISSLEDEALNLRHELESLQREMGEARINVSKMSERLQSINSQFETMRSKESELALELTRMSAAIEAYRNRSEELGEWIEEAQVQLEETIAAIEEADERFSTLDEEVANRQQKSEDARLAWERARDDAHRAEQAFNVFAYTQREVELALKTLSERIAEAQRAQLLAQNEQTELKEKIEAVSVALEELDEDSEKAGLQELLSKREAAVEELEKSKADLNLLSQKPKKRLKVLRKPSVSNKIKWLT